MVHIGPSGIIVILLVVKMLVVAGGACAIVKIIGEYFLFSLASCLKYCRIKAESLLNSIRKMALTGLVVKQIL